MENVEEENYCFMCHFKVATVKAKQKRKYLKVTSIFYLTILI